ncbi:MAG: hypothetical protein ACI957_004052, partial [Verrucomicrobiales bacterium]
VDHGTEELLKHGRIGWFISGHTKKNFICPTSQLLYAYIFAYLTLRLPSRLIRTCPQPRSYSATGGAQARAELPKKWKVFYTVGCLL